MTGYHCTSSGLSLLLFLTVSQFHLAAPNPAGQGDGRNPDRNLFPDMKVNEDWEKSGVKSLQEEETDEELFKDVDPKTLAAVLLEALNHSYSIKNVESEHKGEVEGEENQQVGVVKGVDRDRGRREKLEQLMATQEREQEEERKKAQEEEEKMTEKVTSHTKSHTIQAPLEPKSTNLEGAEENVKQGGSSPEHGDEEEQLNPEELKSLETMMKEFPRVDTVRKRKIDSDQNLQDSRGYNKYYIPISKGGNLSMSKKKLKWQEETQKALNLPSFRGGNFMDNFVDGNDEKNSIESQVPPAETENMEEDSPNIPEDEEDFLSPEEEEAQAKAEQEEISRQAAEAQQAKLEEEKLADVASDMLLHYMVKQTNGNKKHNPALSNAAEDKRSEEEQEVNQEDDIDPQTIDKLIEISSKLHLPADDVVDIISDVEKKKKKDMTPFSSSLLSKNSFVPPKLSAEQTRPPPPAVNLLKTWFQGKTHTKAQDRWGKTASSLLSNQNRWSKDLSPLSFKEDIWHKTPKPVWTGYQSYPINYPFYYKRKLYPSYYSIYNPVPPLPKPHYYIPKPFATNKFLDNSPIIRNKFDNRYRYQGWVQPQLKIPPSFARSQPYYKSYPLPLYQRTLFQNLDVPESRPLPRFPVIGPLSKQRYYSAPVPGALRNNKYGTGKQSDCSSGNCNDLENYIRQILMNRAHWLD